MVVDSGDLLNEDEEIPENVQQSAKLKADAIAQMYKYIGIDAVDVGELDLVLGIDYLKELQKKYDFPFVSANLVDAKDTPIFKRYIIKKINDKNVGIFGIIGDTSEMTSKVSEITKDAVSIQDPLQAAEAVVKELTGKVDYIVALTHQGTNRDWVIARRVKGIDLVVGGHDKQKTKEPFEADKTLIVQAGEKGQYVGILEIAMDGTKSAHNTLVPLGEEIANDPKVKAMITAYNDKVADMYGGATENKPAATTAALRLTACEPCHGDMVKKWKTTDHAKAYETLVKKSKQFDPKCLACHTVRFEQPGGFNMKQQQMELVNVQCESCHGYANEHLSDMKPIPTQKPTLALCLKCHTADRCPNFERDAKDLFAKIKH
ncbi:MAG TPA: multiheme c-type cytochrome [Acidobacteriota bacterium]|nr:multiheme c-type cytochrome [Acidobacteriota bacterium]